MLVFVWDGVVQLWGTCWAFAVFGANLAVHTLKNVGTNFPLLDKQQTRYCDGFRSVEADSQDVLKSSGGVDEVVTQKSTARRQGCHGQHNNNNKRAGRDLVHHEGKKGFE